MNAQKRNERNDDVIEDIRSGLRVNDVAEKYGITRARVHQIVTSSVNPYREFSYAERAEIVDRFCNGETIRMIAIDLQATRDSLSQVIREVLLLRAKVNIGVVQRVLVTGSDKSVELGAGHQDVTTRDDQAVVPEV